MWTSACTHTLTLCNVDHHNPITGNGTSCESIRKHQYTFKTYINNTHLQKTLDTPEKEIRVEVEIPNSWIIVFFMIFEEPEMLCLNMGVIHFFKTK